MVPRMTLALAMFAAMFVAQDAPAQGPDPLALPSMARCKVASHPLLPKKWRGTYLMAPFIRAQLTLGELVVDGSIPAVRVRLFGLRRGSLDLFIHGRKTFVLPRDQACLRGLSRPRRHGPAAIAERLGRTGCAMRRFRAGRRA